MSEQPKRGRLWPKLLLLAVVTGLFLCGAELYLRRFFPIREPSLELDDRYLFKYRSNVRRLFSDPWNGTGRVLVTLNREGRRGELVRPDVARRIVVYGDSYIAGEFSALKQTFVGRLESKLAGRLTGETQVINAGVPGYGPDQIALRMEAELDALKPSMVIVSIFSGNDYGDLLRNKLFKLDAQEQLVTNRFVLQPTDSEHWLAKPSPFHLVRVAQAAGERVRAGVAKLRAPKTAAVPTAGYMKGTNLAGGLYFLSKRKAEYENYVEQGDHHTRDLFWDDFDADVAFEPDSPSARYRRVLMERVIEKMQALTKARGVPLVLLVVPSPYEILDDYEWLHAGDFPNFKRSILTDILEDIARRHQVPCLNLYHSFRGHVNRPSLFFQHDIIGHWNDAGQELAAEQMAEFLTKRAMLR